MRVVIQYPAHPTKKELQQFFSLVGYYHNFCKNFSTVIAPLTELLKGKVQFVWSTSCHKVFDNIKSLLCLSPLLAAPCMERPFKLYVDTSDIGGSAVTGRWYRGGTSG